MPFLATRKLRQAVLYGRGMPVPAQLPEKIVHPLVLLLLLGGVWIWLPEVDSTAAMSAYLGAAVVSQVVAGRLSSRLAGRTRSAELPSPHDRSLWSAELGPFLFFSCLEAIHVHSSLLLVGVLSNPEQAGLFAVASRLVIPVGFILMAANTVLMSRIPALHAAGDCAGLEQLLSRVARLATAGSFVLFLGLLVAGPWLLALFGDHFTAAWLPLMVLAAGYLVNAATGSVGLLLLLTGNQYAASACLAGSTLLTVLLSFFLAEPLGALGIAVSCAAGMTFLNVSQSAIACRKLNVNPTVFGGRSFPLNPAASSSIAAH